MTKSKLETLAQELAESRLRLSRGEWLGEEYTAMSRVRELEALPLEGAAVELRRHVVVSAIAALQSFHRAVIVALVEAGSPYRDRAAELVSDKFTLRDTLAFLGGGKISVAELIAHAAPAGSIHVMFEALASILACDMRQAMTVAVRPHARNDPEAVVILSDVDGLLSDLREAFQLRNILAHEVAPMLALSAEKARGIVRASGLWMEAIVGILWATAFKDRPLAQMEMNVAAGERLRVARAELAQTLAIARKFADHAGRRTELRANHFKWKVAAKEWVDFAYWNQDGSMWIGIGADELALITDQRRERLAAWIEWQIPR